MSVAPKRANPLARIVLILVGLLLVVFGLRAPLVAILGESTSGVVTGYEENRDDDGMVDGYSIDYVFTTSDGARHSGSFNERDLLSAYGAGQEGKMITVRYLSFFPAFNVAVGHGPSALGSLLLIALGVGLLVFGVAGRQAPANSE